MADEGTAVLDAPDTAAPEADTAAEAPETEAIDEAPETGDAEETPDSDDDSEPETLTREEHDKLLKAERAKLEESFRRKEEAAVNKANSEAYKQQLQAAENVVGGWAYQQLSGLAKDMETVFKAGNEVDPQALQNRIQAIAFEMNRSHALRETDAHYKVFLKKLGDYKAPAEDISDYERALASRNPQAAHDALFKLIEGRAYSKAKTDLADEQKKASETAKLQEGAKVAKAAQRPTSGAPAGTAKPMTLAQIDAMSTREWDAIGASDKDGGKQRRADILNKAHELAQK